MLANALNLYNTRTPNRIVLKTDIVSVVIGNKVAASLVSSTAPGDMDFGVIFASQDRFDIAVDVIDYVNGRWIVDESEIDKYI